MGTQERNDYAGEAVCLKCRKKFQSRDRRFNRLCKKCAAANKHVRVSPLIPTAGLHPEVIDSED